MNQKMQKLIHRQFIWIKNVLQKKLKVMDSPALSLSMDNNIPIIVFDLMKENKTQSSYSKRNGANIKFEESDIRPIILSELMSLQKKIKSGIKQTKDKKTKDHLNYLDLLIKKTTENILSE